MPTYEYKCPAGHLFEKFSPTMHDRRREKCPECGKQAERLISGGSGLLFKGSGFYITDYKRSAEPGASKEAKQGGGDSTPEAKPADNSKKKTSSGDK